MCFTVKLIIIILLAVICIILFSKIKIRIFLSENGYISVNYLFLRHRFHLNDKFNKEILKKSNKNKKGNTNKKDNNYVKKLFKQKGVLDGTVEILSIIKLVFKKLFKFFKKIDIVFLNLSLKFSEGDAAATSITYGGICAVVYPLIGWINAFSEIKKQKVDIQAVYTEQKQFDFCFEAVLNVKFVSLIWVVISFFWSVFKTKINISKKGC